MVTRNWFNLFKAQRAQQSISKGIKDVNGNELDVGYVTSSAFMEEALETMLFRTNVVVNSILQDNGTMVGMNPPPGIELGSGSTPPTFDDYKLETTITSDISAIVTSALDEDNDVIFNIEVINNGSAITVAEVGFITTRGTGVNGMSGKYVLTERTVLDSPVNIPSGGTALITYAIKLPKIGG